jgi:hypothetical protein
MADISASSLLGRWVHSREEDAGVEIVFRPAEFKFPRARGRDAFQLLDKNVLIDQPIAPGDGNLNRPGRWELTSTGELRFFASPNSATPAKVLQIVSAGPDRLVLRAK